MTEFSLPDVSKYLDLSSLHLLATTNQPPSVVEAVHIGDLLPGAEEALVCVETTIERLKEQLERAETARVQLERAIAVYKTVTSPVRRLPNELISEIIDFAHPDNISVFPIDDSPWALGHICSQWRAVLTCHRVWAHIYLHAPSARVVHPSKQLPILKEILRRSGNHLLDIELVFGQIPSSYQHFLEEILTSCSRWKRLSLYMEDSCGTFDLLNKKHDQFPELQHLSLCINDYFCDRKLTAFHSTPALYDLELTSFFNERLSECIPLPWSQIRDLKVTQYSGGDLSSILSLCSSLETLRCCDGPADSHRDGQVDSDSPYLLPSVRYLEIQQGSILRRFSFPALESLSFTRVVDEYDIDPNALSALASFTRQSRSLKYLCLDLDVDDRLFDILRNCYHLESFHFQPRNMEIRHFENLMHHMSRQQNVTSLLPHLWELSIDMSKHEHPSWECFVEMLSSRWNSPDDQLFSIQFIAQSRQSFSEDELSLLQEYKEDGLDVQVITDGIQVV